MSVLSRCLGARKRLFLLFSIRRAYLSPKRRMVTSSKDSSMAEGERDGGTPVWWFCVCVCVWLFGQRDWSLHSLGADCGARHTHIHTQKPNTHTDCSPSWVYPVPASRSRQRARKLKNTHAYPALYSARKSTGGPGACACCGGASNPAAPRRPTFLWGGGRDRFGLVFGW